MTPVETGTIVNTPGPDADGVPALPGADSGYVATHSGSVANPLILQGNEYLVEVGGGNRPGETSPNGQTLLPGGEDELAFAMYDAEVFGSDRPVSLSFDVAAATLLPGGEDELPLAYWIGLSNYSRNAWEWLGPYDDSTELTLNSEAVRDRYVTPGTDPVMYFLVVTDSSEVEPTPQNPDGLAAVEVVVSSVPNRNVDAVDYFDTVPPYTDIESSGTGSGKGVSDLDPCQCVTLTWDHVEDPYDADCEAVFVRVYRKRIDRTTKQPIGTVDALAQTYTDPDDNSNPNNTVIPGATYQYWITAGNDAGSACYSAPQAVEIPLLPPSNLDASDGTHADLVRLTWDAADGATGYLVYRDDVIVAEPGNVTTWDDTTLSDFNPHTYKLKSTNAFAVSAGFSPSDIGFRSTAPVVILTIGEGQESGTIPHTVDFDASASYDPEVGTGPGDGIDYYDWDFDGDGTWDINHGGAVQTHIYPAPGTYTAQVQVTDFSPESSTGFIDIDVADAVPEWHSEVIATESAADVDLTFPTLAIDSHGYPSVSYVESTGGASGDAEVISYDGSAWSPLPILTDQGICTLMEFHASADRLVAAFSVEAAGTPLQLAQKDPASWIHQDIPDTEGFLGFGFSVLPDGAVVGACYEKEVLGDRQLFFTEYSAGWSTTLVDDTFDSIANVTSNMAMAYNPATAEPVIAYTVFPDADLRVAKHVGGIWAIETVADIGETGYYPAIAVNAAGEIGVVYMDWTNRNLMFAFDNGSGLWSREIIDSTGSPGVNSNSIAFNAAGQLAVTYHEATGEDLRFAYYDGLDWYIETIDGDSAGFWSDLAYVDGTDWAVAYNRRDAASGSEIVYTRYGLALY